MQSANGYVNQNNDLEKNSQYFGTIASAILPGLLMNMALALVPKYRELKINNIHGWYKSIVNMKALFILFVTFISLSGSTPETTSEDQKSEEIENTLSIKASLTIIVDNDTTKIDARSDFNNKLSQAGTLRRNFTFEAGFQNPLRNVVCSPVTSLLTIAQLALGANTVSRQELYETIGVYDAHELKSTFRQLIKDLSNLDYVKTTAISRLFISDTAKVKSEFIEASYNIFQYGVQRISFANPNNAADHINDWILNMTNGKISEILTPHEISPNTSLIIVNAIYIRAFWHKPFLEVDYTYFYSPTGEREVTLMSRTGHYNYVNSEVMKARIVEIPYRGMETSLILVLPQEKDGLPALASQLNRIPNLLNNELNRLERRRVILKIPKFHITSTLNLTYLYNKIGMWYGASENGTGLTDIVEDQELDVPVAVQKAVIEVRQLGTERGPPIGVPYESLGPLTEIPVIFVANHPFLFYVQSKSEQLLGGFFVGPERK